MTDLNTHTEADAAAQATAAPEPSEVRLARAGLISHVVSVTPTRRLSPAAAAAAEETVLTALCETVEGQIFRLSRRRFGVSEDVLATEDLKRKVADAISAALGAGEANVDVQSLMSPEKPLPRREATVAEFVDGFGRETAAASGGARAVIDGAYAVAVADIASRRVEDIGRAAVKRLTNDISAAAENSFVELEEVTRRLEEAAERDEILIAAVAEKLGAVEAGLALSSEEAANARAEALGASDRLDRIEDALERIAASATGLETRLAERIGAANAMDGLETLAEAIQGLQMRIADAEAAAREQTLSMNREMRASRDAFGAMIAAVESSAVAAAATSGSEAQMRSLADDLRAIVARLESRRSGDQASGSHAPAREIPEDADFSGALEITVSGDADKARDANRRDLARESARSGPDTEDTGLEADEARLAEDAAILGDGSGAESDVIPRIGADLREIVVAMRKRPRAENDAAPRRESRLFMPQTATETAD